MPAITLTITEDQLFTTLRAFLLTLVDSAVEIVQGQDNGVPLPVGPFVMLTPLISAQLATPVSTYDATTRSIKQSTRFNVQVDCYGAGSGDRAKVFCEIFRTDYACDALAAGGSEIAPLYCDDAIQTPLVSGEEQYVERWTFNAVMQYNPAMTLPQQTANTLEVGIVNVDVKYPPGA